MSALKTAIATARPPFLLLTPLSVLLGYAAVRVSGIAPDTLSLWLVLLGALSAHISVNTINEYDDYRSGLDERTERTPFSGGSGALPANPAAAPLVRTIAVISLVVTFLVGLYFVYLRGPLILGVGLLGGVIILTYTRWLNRWTWLCLVAPGLGFGPLMVWGTSIALSGRITEAAVWLSLPAFLLVNNLLLLNQFPDVEADRSVGRNHAVIRYGKPTSTAIYLTMLLSAYAAILVAVLVEVLPMLSLIALLTMPLAIPIFKDLHRHAVHDASLVRPLALNVAVVLSTMLLLSIGVLSVHGG